MTAKELLEKLIGEGLPPEGWGRWVWKEEGGGYGLSSLLTSGTLPPVKKGEEALFWWGGIRLADVPYWPEGFIPQDLLPEDVDTVEEAAEWLRELDERAREEVEGKAEKVLVGHLLAEVIRELPPREWEEFVDALRGLEVHPEAQTALELIR